MTNKFTTITLSLLVGTAILFGPMPALAQSISSSAKSKNLTARMSNLVTRANKEIDRRITGLTELTTRIQDMQKVSDANKSSLNDTVQNEISNLTTLKTKIAADTDLATLRTDVQSITKSYRIYALVLPQVRITAAADRVMDIANTMTGVATKFQSRISDAQTARKDVTSAQAALTDFNTKISDANTQAQAAVAEISSLTPDQGNQTQMQSNTQALKDARAKIKTATADLQTARKDAQTIVQALKKLSPSTSSTSTTTQ